MTAPRIVHSQPYLFRSLADDCPPANKEAEFALLGALLANNRAFAHVSDFLRAEHFSDPINGHIYAAIVARIENKDLADPVTLRAEFEQSGLLNDVGGIAYLATLVRSMVSISHARDYARAIVDAASRRQIYAIARELIEATVTPASGDDPRSIVSRATDAMDRVIADDTTKPGCYIYDGAKAALDHADSASRGELDFGRKTGFPSIDAIIGGLEDRTFNILAARPGMGKTALGVQIATTIAKQCRADTKAGKKPAGVLMISLEMSAKQIGRRHLSEISRVPVMSLKGGDIKGKQSALIKASRELQGLPFWIEDCGGQDIAAIRSKSRSAARRFGKLALILVDHLHIVKQDAIDRRQGNTQAIGQISNSLRDLSKELDCPVLALAQLNRDLEKREEKRPQRSDLRASGDIEQDADLIMFLHRPETFIGKGAPERQRGETEEKYRDRVRDLEDHKERNRGKAEVIIDKLRDGEPGIVELEFDGATTSFREARGSAHKRGWESYDADDPGPRGHY